MAAASALPDMGVDSTVPGLGAAGTLADANVFLVIQSNVAKRVTLLEIKNDIDAQGKADTAETSAKSYADGVAATAETNAKSYTDSEISDLDTAAQSYATAAAQSESNLRAAAAALTAALATNGQRISSVGDATADTDALRARRVEGTVDVDISSGSGGTFNLTTTHLSYGHINLTGTLSGDVIVKFPTGVERNVRITRSTTGAAVCRIEGYSSGFTYLLPGQHRKVYHGADIFRCAAHRVLFYTALITLSGDTLAGTPVDHTLCKLPAGSTIKEAKVRVSTAISGSTSQVSMGYTGTYARILKLTSISTVGTLVGNSSDDLGTDWDSASKKFGAYLTSSETLKLRHALSGGDCTAGVVRVTLVVEYEGELSPLRNDAEEVGGGMDPGFRYTATLGGYPPGASQRKDIHHVGQNNGGHGALRSGRGDCAGGLTRQRFDPGHDLAPLRASADDGRAVGRRE